LLGGGRLIVINADQRIIRLEPAGVLFAQRAGFDLHCGDVIAPSQLVAIAQEMAGAIVQAVREPQAPELMPLYLTDPLSADELARVEGVRASGGVAEFIYGREKRDFWDLGLSLGRALNGFAALPWPLLEAGECIRATVFGASHFSVQLSGDTLFISSPSVLLPCRNLAVIQPDIDCAGALDEAVIGQAIAAHRRSFDLADAQARFALALRWRGEADYQRLLRLAHGMIKGLSDIIAAGGPLYIIIDGDVAHTLGALLKIELAVPSEVLVIDGIALRDFDYVDIGRIRLPSHSVPVSVKSLMFGAVQKKL
jgi:ethanolamine utilization protein EutA